MEWQRPDTKRAGRRPAALGLLGASYTGKPKPASTPARCSYALVNGSRSPLKTKRLPQRAQFPAKQVVCRGYAVLFATECIEPALRSIAPHHNSTSSRACKSMDFWARRYGSVGVGPGEGAISTARTIKLGDWNGGRQRYYHAERYCSGAKCVRHSDGARRAMGCDASAADLGSGW